VLVVLMRHGRAEGRRPGLRDEDRRLTPEGRRGVEAVARLLPLDEPPLILYSPLRRAVETAEIVARVTGGEARLEPRLHPGDFGVEALQEILGEHWGGRPLVLVGHNPSMEEAVAGLVGGAVALEPGAAAVVEAAAPGPGGGELVALITPTAALRCPAWRGA